MNTTSENISMIIVSDELALPELALPPLIRVVSAEIDFLASPYCREHQKPFAPRLETQVSAEIDWESWPYCLSFPEREPVAPRLETQVSAEIDWESWPYCLSFPGVSGACKL